MTSEFLGHCTSECCGNPNNLTRSRFIMPTHVANDFKPANDVWFDFFLKCLNEPEQEVVATFSTVCGLQAYFAFLHAFYNNQVWLSISGWYFSKITCQWKWQHLECWQFSRLLDTNLDVNIFLTLFMSKARYIVFERRVKWHYSASSLYQHVEYCEYYINEWLNEKNDLNFCVTDGSVYLILKPVLLHIVCSVLIGFRQISTWCNNFG